LSDRCGVNVAGVRLSQQQSCATRSQRRFVLSNGDAAGEELFEAVTAADVDVVQQQLGRPPRAIRAIAARCPEGHPAVIQTNPRLENGTPFPTLYYLTCPRLTSLVGKLEASGIMREMTARLDDDAELAAAYRRAHESYLARRDALESLGNEVSAGGMPHRVKCLHVHLAHSLACGSGINPFGDETAGLLWEQWPDDPCVRGVPDSR